MKGRLYFDGFRLSRTDSGAIEFTLYVKPECRYAAQQIAKEMRKSDKSFLAMFEEQRERRSLDQNALMWALLKIYAEAQSGGRPGDVSPEDIYRKMLSRYGIAEFLVIPTAAVDGLKRAYKDVVVIDDAVIERGGKRTPAKAVKCVIGSSKYDKKQMSALIDGIFDDLAMIGVDASTSRDVAVWYDEWQRERSRNERTELLRDHPGERAV